MRTHPRCALKKNSPSLMPLLIQVVGLISVHGLHASRFTFANCDGYST